MSLFTQKMKMLTAVVLDGYSDAVVKALLEEGVMDFVHISQLDGEQASRLSSRKVDIPTGAIGDLRGRCENLMKLGGLDLPPISKSDVDSLGSLDMDACRRTLDGLSSGMAGLREEQRNLNQRLVAYDEMLSYVKEKKTEYIDLRIGSISADRKLDDFMMRLAPYCAVVAKDDRGMLVSLSLKRDVSRIDEIMDKFGWTESPKADKDSLQIASRALEEKRASIQGKVDDLARQVKERIAAQGEDLKRMWILLRVSELSGHVESFFSYTRNTTLFSGWVPEEESADVESIISHVTSGRCIIEWTEADEIPREEVPVEMTSPKILRPFERMVSNYSTPEYGSINPTPFTAVAYLCMFALMFADLGQGFILLLVGLIGKWLYGKNPTKKDGIISRYLCSLLIFLGPASMVGGLLFGSCFGFSLIPALWFNFDAVVEGEPVQGLIQDLETLGFLFEALVERDLDIYAKAIGGKLYHYQDYNNKEADAVVQLSDGRWGAFEIKLGSNSIDGAAQGLVRLKAKIEADSPDNAPSFLAVIAGTVGATYKRPDGVHVFPLTSLKP